VWCSQPFAVENV